MKVRANESNKTWFRSERFCHTGEGWWISTREQIELGPFETQKEADNNLCLFIRAKNMELFNQSTK